MKAFLAPEVKKFVLEELAFEFFFNFLVLDRFSLLLLTPLALPELPSAFCVLVWVLWDSSSVDLLIVQSIEVNGTAILLEFLMNLLWKFAKPKNTWMS